MDSQTDFVIKLTRSGQVISVGKQQSVLDALRAGGWYISSSCEQGVCGTCLTKVLEGEPDHWDMFLTADEQAANDQFMPCCSRSKSAVLVLDL